MYNDSETHLMEHNCIYMLEKLKHSNNLLLEAFTNCPLSKAQE